MMSHPEPVYLQKQWFDKPIVLLVVILPFLGVLTSILLLWNRYVFWQDIALLFAFTLLTGIGLAAGYHRMLTHQSFRTFPLIKGLLLIFGCMGFEGGPLTWAATHTLHHARSDEEGDPHSPIEGFWHAHMGWIFRDKMEDPKTYVPHLLEDPVITFVDRWSGLWIALSLVLPFVLGGWTGFVWGGLVRIFVTNHVTFSVNSVCHMFGKRPFETTDESRNNWIVGLLAFGEGWHNNHHAFPTNAFHGMHWWQFDLSGLVIRGLEKLGLVWEVQRVSHELLEAQQVRAKKAQEAVQELRSQLTASLEKAEKELVAVERAAEIRRILSRASHLKKQKLTAYLGEIQQLMMSVKATPVGM